MAEASVNALDLFPHDDPTQEDALLQGAPWASAHDCDVIAHRSDHRRITNGRSGSRDW